MDQYPRLGRGGGSLVTGADRGGSGGVNDGDGRVVLTLIPPPQPNPLLPGAGGPRTLTVAGTSVERAPGSVLTWRNGQLVEVPTIAPTATVTSAREFIDSTVGSDTGGLLLDVVEGSGSSGAQIIGLLSQRNSDEPLPVPAGAVTGVSTSAGNDDVRMLLAGTDDTDRVRLRGNNGEPVAGAGGRISSIITGLPPGTQGEVSLRSTPRLLGTFTVDADGVASFVADVPGDLPAGSHTLVLATFSGQQEAVVSVGMTVVARAGMSGGTPGSTPPTTTPATPTTTSPPLLTMPPNTVPVQVAPPLPPGASPEVLRQRGEELVNTIGAVLPEGVASPVAVQETPSGVVVRGLLTNPATGQPLAVPVQNILLAQGDGTALVLATAGADGSSTALTVEGKFQLPPGGRMGAAIAGFPAASDGQIVLFSQPTLLGTFTTDINGVFAGDFALPTELTPGQHTLVFIVGEVSQSLDVLVTGSEAPSGSLPATGAQHSAAMTWALVMMAAGGLVIATRRRPRRIGI
jgi:LPXTG-motif cell wall-anchored protein